jgi:hypothetical protein
MGSLQTGGPRIRWLDDVCDDIKVITMRNLEELSLYRKVSLGQVRLG